MSALRHPIYCTRTLSLEAVRPSIYTVLPHSWLHDILVKFPGLRELRMSEFPFFDAVSLLAVKAMRRPHVELLHLSVPSSYNSTATGLCDLLDNLPRLQALDLSNCSGAGNILVLKCIPPTVRTLTLRDLDLTDANWKTVAIRVGLGIRSLDVRGNSLTDAAVQVMLDCSFAPPGYLASSSEAVVEAGLTHLRIADNNITVSGAIKFIKTSRLVTLDLGTPASGSGDILDLVPALSVYGHHALRTIRLSHGIVTNTKGLRRRMLPRLKTLVLCGVPEWMGKQQVEALVQFIATTKVMEEDCLETLELEMVTPDEAEDGGGVLDGEFSFFDGDQEGGSSWAGARASGGERVETLKEVKRVRGAKMGWQGRIRVVRDLGGRETQETGVEGERWGLVREGY